MDNPGKSEINTENPPRVLVAPLDWGLGHATRCIPVIRELQAAGAEVWLAGEGAAYPDLDIAWAQWEGPGRRWPTPEAFRDENVAKAKQLGLGLIVGLNQLNGGDGSSGVRGTTDNPNHWEMSAAELARVGTLLVQTPYACAFVSWAFALARTSR